MKDVSENWRAESPEVVCASGGVVTLDAEGVNTLIREAGRNPRRRIRLCAHTHHDDAVHEMIIVHDRACYVRPHKHVEKSESFHVVAGDVDVVVFDDSGSIRDVIPMGPFESGRAFYYRIAEPLFHTLLIRSEILVFHETTSGPFRREQTVFAPWAPAGDDSDEVRRFLAHMDDAVDARGGTQS